MLAFFSPIDLLHNFGKPCCLISFSFEFFLFEQLDDFELFFFFDGRLQVLRTIADAPWFVTAAGVTIWLGVLLSLIF